MSQSENLLDKLMNQYLDETRNFGSEEEVLLCENLFNKTKKLLTESKNNGFKILTEVAQNNEERELVEDFKIYVKMLLGNEFD